LEARTISQQLSCMIIETTERTLRRDVEFPG
jgi:hypothetical protein